MSNPPDDIASVPFQILVAAPGEAERWTEVVAAGRALSTEPFASERTAVLEALSQELFAHPRLRRDPAGAALGFWLRRSSLAALAADFHAYAGGKLLVPAGLAFHVTPANVDTMFLYSWALSYLAGNANIVRLTTRSSPLLDDLLAVLAAVFARSGEAGRGNLFLTYGHDDAMSARLSAGCDVRMVWGGDETVRRLRAVPLNPHAAERAFASKRSLSAVAAAAYAALDDAGREKLAERMAADLAPFGQMACSSPHVLYWIGPAEKGRAFAADFSARLERAMAAKSTGADPGWAVRRINFAFAAAASGTASSLRHRPHTTTVVAAASGSAEPAETCGAGLLNHALGATLEELATGLRPEHQTITHFGLADAERDRLARLAGRAGADRVVPIGRALDFGATWDGYNLWADLTRSVVVQ
ncbi:MAG TPA: acyl-CoA reductase [Opitutaceae bacterium]|nr:acyl-CoA reductase [Opitutaceae bacterium]